MKIRSLSGAVLIGLLTAGTAFAADTSNNATLSDAQKKQVQEVVHDYLVKNPEVLVESFQILQQKQMEQAQKSIEKTHDLGPKYANELFHNAKDPAAGSSTGKIILVEFFDYQCPHCTVMGPMIQSIIQANPDLRVVYKEFPIRGPMSELAARAALAAQLQGKYVPFHNALLIAGQSQLTPEIIYKVAQDAGLDVEKLKKDMKDSLVDGQIKDNLKLGQQLQLLGTPAMFVAKSDIKPTAAAKEIVFIPGQVNQDQLQTVIKQFS